MYQFYQAIISVINPKVNCMQTNERCRAKCKNVLPDLVTVLLNIFKLSKFDFLQKNPKLTGQRIFLIFFF